MARKKIYALICPMNAVDFMYRYGKLDGVPTWKGVAAELLNKKEQLKLL